MSYADIIKTCSASLYRLSTAVALIVCIVTASVFVKWAWDKFSNSPIVVNVETTNYPLYRLHFPAVTICPANIIKKTIGEEILARYWSHVLDPSLSCITQILVYIISLNVQATFFRVCLLSSS